MSVTATPIFPQTIKSKCLQFDNSSGTTVIDIFTAGTDGSRIDNIYLTNTDASNAYGIQFYIYDGSTANLIGSVNIPLSSGNTVAAPTVSATTSTGNLGAALSRDADGNGYIYLAGGYKLRAGMLSTITSPKVVTVCVQYGDY